MFVAVITQHVDAINQYMEECEKSRADELGQCECPVKIMQDFGPGMTVDRLTYLMTYYGLPNLEARSLPPTTWTDPRGYCGDASCDDPICISLPLD